PPAIRSFFMSGLRIDYSSGYNRRCRVRFADESGERSRSREIALIKSPMNTFDMIVIAVGFVAVVMCFASGLLRSLSVILAYLIAASIALALTPRLMPLIFGQGNLAADRTWITLFAVFIVLGLVISALLRKLVDELAGEDIGLFDRLMGAALGAVRSFL